MTSESFKSLFMPYYKKMYYVAFKLIGNQDEAKDIVQNALMKLWIKREDITEIKNIEAYCVGVTKNLCMDCLRSKHTIFTDIESFDKSTSMAYEQNDLEKSQSLDQIMEIIRNLPPQQQEIIRLRCINDLSIKEIEDSTGLSNMNIRTLLSRARKKIKEEYTKQLIEQEYGN